jgi:hypothetical protein
LCFASVFPLPIAGGRWGEGVVLGVGKTGYSINSASVAR